MPLSNDKKAELKPKLVRKLVENSTTNLTWSDVQAAVAALTQEEKDRIVKALAGSGEDIRPIISGKIRLALEQSVDSAVDAVLLQDTVDISILYRVMK